MKLSYSIQENAHANAHDRFVYFVKHGAEEE